MSNHPKKSRSTDIEVGLIITSVVVLITFIILMVANPDGTLNAITAFFNLMISWPQPRCIGPLWSGPATTRPRAWAWRP